MTVEAFPRDLPHDITVDVSALATLQDGVFVSDLIVGDKVEILDDPEQVIVAIVELADEKEDDISAPADPAGNAAAAAAEEAKK